MNIAIIGAGNVATHIAKAIHNTGHNIVQVYSRTVTSALQLARAIGCAYVTKPERITTEVDLYIISVSDSALKETIETINFGSKLVVHTAGSIPMSVFENQAKNFGVFYPLQTFSKFRDLDIRTVPFCLEASSAENLAILEKMASSLSNDVRIVDSEKRQQLHLSAVFACNFTNHMYTMAEELLSKSDIDFDILHPLILETALKAQNSSPKLVQTGPAARNDMNIIEKHIKMLPTQELKKTYTSMSESIIDLHKDK